MKWFNRRRAGSLAFVIVRLSSFLQKAMAQSDAPFSSSGKKVTTTKSLDALQYGDDSYRILTIFRHCRIPEPCIQAIMLDNQDDDQSLKTFSDSVDIILND